MGESNVNLCENLLYGCPIPDSFVNDVLIKALLVTNELKGFYEVLRHVFEGTFFALLQKIYPFIEVLIGEKLLCVGVELWKLKELC